MSTRARVLAAFSAIALTGALTAVAGPASAGPTCSEELGIKAHGQHIVGDYVSGIGHAEIPWPPRGGVVGKAVAGQGATLPGGPGPGFHFPNGFAPGASFCNEQSRAPGTHF